jgi:GNAT superfamily N-acetyltransferase
LLGGIGTHLSILAVKESVARIERATERDIPAILRMVKSLAEFVGRSGEVIATEQDLRETLFGEHPSAEVALAFIDKEPIGIAVFFSTYSTFLGRAGMYLEDLFVLPLWRKRGCGSQLLAHVASTAVQRGCKRLEWSALNWNEAAVRFYESLGARAQSDSTTFQLSGHALERLGARE